MIHPAIERGLIQRQDDGEKKKIDKELVVLLERKRLSDSLGRFFLSYANGLRARGKKRTLTIAEMAWRGVTFPVEAAK